MVKRKIMLNFSTKINLKIKNKIVNGYGKMMGD